MTALRAAGVSPLSQGYGVVYSTRTQKFLDAIQSRFDRPRMPRIRSGGDGFGRVAPAV
ncbi:hypothetical protein [Nocardia sp. NPDC004722]